MTLTRNTDLRSPKDESKAEGKRVDGVRANLVKLRRKMRKAEEVSKTNLFLDMHVLENTVRRQVRKGHRVQTPARIQQ
ncbi:unnamed protein product [Ceratitis capitata]|uniref:(Mediterranean fruit fly) hypothetical protein n=1 Tax=Ceratitis capitata TaxID=7213 RepID=A0A811UF64_CERCA|nr:unnamed protein product [Ceratitis capitata]